MNHDDELFAEALALPASERSLFLDRACGGDVALRGRIDALLASHDAAAKFLESPVTARAAFLPEEKRGDLIGRYKLLEKIGEGGCGVVWMAEQAEPVRRRVALKVIKLGMDTKEVVARFEAERQALAMMDHPNVAKVFDAGTSHTGRPYFVMELVRGIPITRYCDEKNLPTVERLKLFIQACHAIQHAHQKGIIHRDIKPSNILVAQHDDVAVPKVIDFGIAKATQGRLTDATVFTAFAQFIGTPAYMSPEQAEFSGLDIDTRTDIYSLGVLLYELLTGRPPFDPKSLQQAGLDEVRRIIREVEPARPSTRLDTLADADRTNVATLRGTAPAQLSTLLRGDLDWIVMRALEKNRTRRYESANDFAADLKRHLNNETVVARPPSAAYRIQKLVRRNRLVFAASGAVALTAIAGLSFSTWSFLRERQASARESVQRATAVEAQKKEEAARASEGEHRTQADAQKSAAERQRYVANMNLAQQAWETTDIARLRQLLEETREYPGRGFEWYYWQGETHRALLTLRGYLSNNANVWAVAISPDGRRIVTGNGDDNARVWDAITGEELARLTGHNGAFHSVAFSPDSSRIVTGGADRTAKVWAVTGGQQLFTLEGHTLAVTSVGYSRDGRQIVTGSYDTTARVWDAAGGPALQTFKGHTTVVWSVAFSPTGDRIATGSGIFRGGKERQTLTEEERLSLTTITAKVWNVHTGKEILTFTGHTRSIRAVAFSNNGRWIVTGSGDQTAKLWDASSGEELRTFKGHTAQIYTIAFSPNSERIVTGSHDRTIRIWDVATAQQLAIYKGHETEIWAVAFSPNGKQIVSGSNDKTARVWDASRGSGPLSLNGHAGRIGAVAFSPNGQRILTGSGDKTAKVWAASSGQQLLTLEGHTGPVTSAAYFRDGLQIVTGSFDHTARIWDAAGTRKTVTLEGHAGPVLSVAVSPDGKMIVTGSQDGTARLWETATGRETQLLKGHTAPVSSVAYAPEGRQIVTGSYDKTARVWDVVSGREVRALSGHTGTILSVAYSPNGQSIVTGSGDKTARVWDAGSGREQLTLRGHIAQIASVAYSPDGQRIVTGSEDKSVRVWEATTGQELLTLSGHHDQIGSVAFSADGQQIVTGSDDRTANIWQAASPQQVVVWQKEEAEVAQKLAALAVVRPGLPPFDTRAISAAEYLSELRREWTPEEKDRMTRAHDHGAIKRWLILGPVPLEGKIASAAMDAEQIENERLMTPRAGQRVALASGTVGWRAVTLESFMIDFIAIVGRFSEWSAAWAVCYISSEVEQSGLQLLVGSDGWATVYLNGEQVYRNPIVRGYNADTDRVANVTLKAGMNVLRLKVVAGSVVTRLRDSIRFTDAAGNPVKGISVTLDPDSAK